MTATCACGTPIEQKNAAGHYRDACRECIADAAADECARDHDCAECGNPAVGRPEGEWVCAACWTGIA